MAVALERSATLSGLAPETRCLYDIYKKEGDDLYCKRRYKKALVSYNEALRLVHRNPQTLVARSRCYMGIGMMQRALEDAEGALDINASYLPAIYQKGQILYRQGNYEMSMMTFNRGQRLNPSAPGFLEGIQKAQHAMDIMATGRHMKTTAVGDLSLYIPKKQSSFNLSKKTLPTLGKATHNDDTARLPSPGFKKRAGTLLLQVQKRHNAVLGHPKYGHVDRDKESARRKVNDKAMKDILGQLYEDKAYFERILDGTARDQGLSDMLSSVLEDGLKFLYDRVLFWAQNDSLPPAPPQPQPLSAAPKALAPVPAAAAAPSVVSKADGQEQEGSSDEYEDEEDSTDEIMAKVTDAIDAVSTVNEPGTGRKKKRLKVRKRRADILKKKASMVVVPRKKYKKPNKKTITEHEEVEESTDVSRINFQFNSLAVLAGIGQENNPTGKSSPSGTTTVDESELDTSMEDGTMERQKKREEKRKRRMDRWEKKEKERKAQEEKMKEFEKAKEGKGDNPQEETKQSDPLMEYLDKMMNNMQELFNKNDFPTLKTKAESFLLTMEKYDKSVTGGKMNYVAKAHSHLGNAYVGLRNYDFAIMHFEKDKEIGERWQMPDCTSRALGNIGRVYVYKKKYAEALKYLAEKTKMANSPKENAWLYHEIASCFLQLHHYQFAGDAAKKSFQAAAEINDSLYQLQSSVLLGAIEVKLQNFERAYGSFERAMDHAKLRDDQKAQQAITEALAEVNNKIAREAKLKKLLQEENEQKLLEQQLEEQKIKDGGDGEGATQNKDDPDLKAEDGGEGQESEVSGSGSGVAESAIGTGEDPELAGLTATDDENEDGETNAEDKDGKKVEKEEEEGKEVQGSEEDGKKDKDEEKGKDSAETQVKTGEKEEGEKDKEENREEDDKNDEKNEEEKKKEEEEKDVDENKDDKKETGENSAQLSKETADEVKEGENKVEKDKSADADESEDKKNEEGQEKAGDPSVEVKLKEGKEPEKKEVVTEEAEKGIEEKEESEKAAVAIVVTGEEGKEDNTQSKSDGKETDNEEKDEKDGDKLGEKSSDEGTDITYKARPITQESLAKSLNVDKGTRDAMKKSVVSLHEAVRESETRQGVRKPENIEASTKKTVTISDEDPEVLNDEKKKKEEEEEEKKRKAEEEEKIPEEPRGKDRICDKVEDELVLMEKEYADKKFDDVLKRGNEMMKMLKKLKNIDGWSKRRLMNFAKLHSYMGSASSEKQNFDKARMHHNADLKIGEVIQNNFIQSRALEHLGRTFIFENKHEKALEFFARRAHLPRSSEVTARLFHEIANCFFQLKAYEFAKDAAMVSLKAANQGGHSMFQLQSSVLIAVTKVKLLRTDAAYSTFQEALNYALIRDDENAADAIRQAIAQIETKVATDVKNRWMQKVKDSKTARLSSQSESEKSAPKQNGDNMPSAEPSKAVMDVLNSMNEEDKNHEVIDETEEDDAEGNKGDNNKGSETSRTDKSGFLIAPDAPMDKTKKVVDKLVKMSKDSDSEHTGSTTGRKKKKVVKIAGVEDDQQSKTGSSKQTSSSNPNQQNDSSKKSNSNSSQATNKKMNMKPSTVLAAKASKTQTKQAKYQQDVTKSGNKEGIKAETTTSKKTESAVERKLTKPASAVEREMGVVNQENGERAVVDGSDGGNDKNEGEEVNVTAGESQTDNNATEEIATKEETEINSEVKAATDEKESKKSKQKEDAKKSKDKGKIGKEQKNKSKSKQENSKTDPKQNEQPQQQQEQDQISDVAKNQDGAGDASNEVNLETQSTEDNTNNLETINEDGTGNEKKNEDNENEKNPNESSTESTKAKSVTGAPPSVRSKPRPNLMANISETKPPMKRRPSERFIGLDAKKIAAAKANPQQKPEDQQKTEPPPKPKLPRFIGISPRKEKPKEDGANKTPKAQNEQLKLNFNSNQKDPALKTSPRKENESDVTVPADKNETTITEKTPTQVRNEPAAPESKAVSDPAINNGNDNANDDYDVNPPVEPIITLNDEVGLVRRDSTASKHSATRPATRMSLADMVKDDKPPIEDGKTSKAELSALNALVKESIKRDKTEMKKIKQEQMETKPGDSTKIESPRKASKAKENNAVIQRYRMEEMRREAAAKRARRQRFLRNRKQSFVMMLTSPYSEISSVTGRKLSYDFVNYRRSMANSNLSLVLKEDGTYYDEFSHDKHGHANLMWKRDGFSGYELSPRKGMQMGMRRGSNRKYSEQSSVSKDSENVLDSLEHYLQKDAAGGGGKASKSTQKSKHQQAEENRISKEIELAARQMRRREREERRDERRKLEKDERKRRKEEQEEKDLLTIMSSKPSFDNPYDKNPAKIPELDQRDRFNDDDEKRWIRAQEKKILRERRRAQREAQINKKHEEEKQKRKMLMKATKDRSPRTRKAQQETADDKQDEQQYLAIGDESLDVSPELDTPLTGRTPREDEEEEEAEVEERKEEIKAEEEEKDDEQKNDEGKEKEKEEELPKEAEKTDEKKDEEKQEKKPEVKDEKPEVKEKKPEVKEEEKKEEEKEEKKEEKKEEEDEKAAEEEEEEDVEDDDFDGYNDSEEDDDDLVAIYIEKEVRQMRADYNVQKIPEVLDRGTSLLKALRKHTDIVSWSRRRLRWFAAAHMYMGSGYVEHKDWQKATSHHRADYRIGEALEDNTIQSRALEHLARVSVLEGNTPKALEHLAKRAHLPRTPEQSARIYHEMANCFFQLGALEFSRDAAVESLQAAREGGSTVYVLQSTLLLAVCQSKLSDFDSASNSFETALKEAKKLDDKNTVAAIEDAKRQLDIKRASMVRDKWKKKAGKSSVVDQPIKEMDEANVQE